MSSQPDRDTIHENCENFVHNYVPAHASVPKVTALDNLTRSSMWTSVMLQVQLSARKYDLSLQRDHCGKVFGKVGFKLNIEQDISMRQT